MSRPATDAKILALTGATGTMLCVLVLALAYDGAASVFGGLAVVCTTLMLIGIETSSEKDLTR